MANEELTKGELQLDKLFSYASKYGASDIHLKTGYQPMLRVQGKIMKLKTAPLDRPAMEKIVKSILSDEHKNARFSERKNIDTALTFGSEEEGDLKRYRVNVAQDNKGPFVVMRVIPEKIIDVKDIGFPFNVWEDIVKLRKGLVLVTGVTGSGKSTTLASIIQEINRTRGEHIITLEDPIEYIHKPDQSIISQREIGSDLSTFGDGVKYALREDPDVIQIGEIRDRDTAEHALQAVMTGHLVLSTLHTPSAGETVRRYVGLFETEDKENVKDTLASNLAYVLSQQLIPYRKNEGRFLAMEVMNVQASKSAGIRHHIREEKYEMLTDDISRARVEKMITMDQHLVQLVGEGKIGVEDAISYARFPDVMRKNYGKD